MLRLQTHIYMRQPHRSYSMSEMCRKFTNIFPRFLYPTFVAYMYKMTYNLTKTLANAFLTHSLDNNVKICNAFSR